MTRLVMHDSFNDFAVYSPYATAGVRTTCKITPAFPVRLLPPLLFR